MMEIPRCSISVSYTHLDVYKRQVLPYPEGQACAEVLVAGEEGGAKAGTVL